ncbi:hypothetical protein EUX98_g758 [Antrodiella citrinella]|uniref:WHIM1 domain-containing protein n=1 Tax=Antrodiella citrinella TaxID=2447956 RepID=A0A4V3XJK6_9APHY|nr:hypothetical protein EUX98_g758 [Antrodiella citrinella]
MKADTTERHDKKAHVCPPSNATHPRDRWESLFVYGFIYKFTQLRGKVEGLETPMDFEDALLSPEANPVMTQILSRFVLNLRSQTRNLSSDVISSTVSSLFQEYFKNNEHSIFWDEEYRTNIDPFQGENSNFWGADWDFKLKVLRQLVEWQLCHCNEIKLRIDRAEYTSLIERLKASVPSGPKASGKMSKLEIGHLALIKALEDRIPDIDAEIARIQRARKKIQQRHLLIAQAEVRETRTRRRAARVDYAYLNDPDTEDDGDEYVDREDQDIDDDDAFMHDGPSNGRRRSTRSTRTGGNGLSAADEWRGERRSTRLGAPVDTIPNEPPPKRARTVESTSSGDAQPSAASSSAGNSLKIKVGGAAAIKPTETAVEAIAGKKKSKFWFYAVEPVAGQSAAPTSVAPSTSTALGRDVHMADDLRNGFTTDDGDAELPPPSESNTNGDLAEKSVERSLSPSNMDESP